MTETFVNGQLLEGGTGRNRRHCGDDSPLWCVSPSQLAAIEPLPLYPFPNTCSPPRQEKWQAVAFPSDHCVWPSSLPQPSLLVTQVWTLATVAVLILMTGGYSCCHYYLLQYLVLTTSVFLFQLFFPLLMVLVNDRLINTDDQLRALAFTCWCDVYVTLLAWTAWMGRPHCLRPRTFPADRSAPLQRQCLKATWLTSWLRADGNYYSWWLTVDQEFSVASEWRDDRPARLFNWWWWMTDGPIIELLLYSWTMNDDPEKAIVDSLFPLLPLPVIILILGMCITLQLLWQIFCVFIGIIIPIIILERSYFPLRRLCGTWLPVLLLLTWTSLPFHCYRVLDDKLLKHLNSDSVVIA